MNHQTRFLAQVPRWALFDWRRAYLVPPVLEGTVRELVEIPPDDRFNRLVGDYVHALVNEGKEPPSAIATAIYNLGDDMLAGRQPTIRTGDYIALQNFLRQRK